MVLKCMVRDTASLSGYGVYTLIRGRLYYDTAYRHVRILSFCLDDPEQSCVVKLPIFEVHNKNR